MKKLQKIIKIAAGWIKKYDFVYDVDGKAYHYDVVSRNEIEDTNLPNIVNAVAIVPVFDDGSLLLIKEFRYPVNDYVYAFPAGLIDEGEDAKTAAVRELWEETGTKVEEVYTVYDGGYSSEGMTDEKLATVICRVSGEIKGCDGKEEVHPIKVSLAQAMELANEKELKFSNKIQLFLAGITFASAKICG